jgi:methionyl-tRNA formyltransferase
VLMRHATPIGPEETTAGLHDRLSEMGASLILQALADLPELTPVPQPEAGVTYAAKIDKSEARIDWSDPAEVVDRKIRGLSPFPGAWCQWEGERVKLLASRLGSGDGQAGQILSGLTVACGSGAVEILTLQREGKRPMQADDFLRGAVLPDRLA